MEKFLFVENINFYNRYGRPGQVVTMDLLRKEFARAQHRLHTKRVSKCRLFLRSVLCDPWWKYFSEIIFDFFIFQFSEKFWEIFQISSESSRLPPKITE